MPELPDVENYCLALNRIVGGQVLEELQLKSPFLLRSVEPPLESFNGQRLMRAWREAKQIVLEFESGRKLLLHLMIAGRLRWREKGKKRQAKLYTLESGEANLEPFRKGGLEVLDADLDTFRRRQRLRNHTLRRALTDQQLFSGVGNGDPLSRPAFPPQAHPEALRGRSRDALSILSQRAARMGGTPPQRSRLRFPGESHGIPPRHSHPRPLSTKVESSRACSNIASHCST